MADAPDRLRHGPYRAPKLKVGAQAYCHFRRCWVAVTGLSNARLPWPEGRPLDADQAVPELVVTNDLVQAIDNESPAALAHWWGVDPELVDLWREKFGVEAPKPPPAPAAPPKRRGGRPTWTEAELRLLGTQPDAVVAKALGRTVGSVRGQRTKLKIAAAPRSAADQPVEARVHLLYIDDSGVLRVVGSPWSLAKIVDGHERGLRPEEIVGAVDPALLATVYQVVACYLRHRDEVKEYLRRQHAEAYALRRKIETVRPVC